MLTVMLNFFFFFFKEGFPSVCVITYNSLGAIICGEKQGKQDCFDNYHVKAKYLSIKEDIRYYYC